MFKGTDSGDAEQGLKSKDIRKRSLRYALRAVKLYQHLQRQKDGAGWIIGKQYLRAATSIGANVEEAQAGESRGDFIHKLGIARKETRESLYWLNVLEQSELVSSKRITLLMKETTELLNVITSIILKTKGKN
ncbi:MAG TPA: four helix bundle protein [Candidatus Acidoferrales bacterium]|nr:four helix bundle protein [Candidatus Acidoferrales bacterium]